MVSGLDIASAFINLGCNEEHCLSQLPLQKLVALAQSAHVYNNGKKLFEDDVLAWEYGPVVRAVWDKFNSYGSGAIREPVAQLNTVEDSVVETLSKVYTVFSPLNTRLVDLTHEAGPWRKYEPFNDVIPVNELGDAWPEYVSKAEEMLTHGSDTTPSTYWVGESELSRFDAIMESSRRNSRKLVMA